MHFKSLDGGGVASCLIVRPLLTNLELKVAHTSLKKGEWLLQRFYIMHSKSQLGGGAASCLIVRPLPSNLEL